MDETAAQQPPNAWERLKIASTVLGTVLIPLVIAFASNGYTSAIKENEIGQRYVSLAIDILSKPPTDASMHTRAWAVKVVDHYSGVRMSDNAQKELIDEQLKAMDSAVKSAVEVLEVIKKVQ